MKPFSAFKIYIAVKTHFNSDHFDIRKYGIKTNVTQASFARRQDSSFFYRAVEQFPEKSKWMHACVCGHLVDKSYVKDILELDDELTSYYARRRRMSYDYENSLEKLLRKTKKLDHIFIQSSGRTDPVIMSFILSGEISLESAVLLNRVFRWVEKARTTDTLLWPDVKQKILKYEAFVPFDEYKYKALTEKVLKQV